MLNDVSFLICVICIFLQIFSSSAGVSESLDHAKESDFVVPDLNNLPPEDHTVIEEGYTNQHSTVSGKLQPSISQFVSEQVTVKRKRKKVAYSSLSQEEKDKRSKANTKRIQIRKQNMVSICFHYAKTSILFIDKFTLRLPLDKRRKGKLEC